MLGIYLLVLATASSGPLHQRLHPGAADPQHHCAATLLNAGLVDVAVSEPGAGVIPLNFIFAAAEARPVLTMEDGLLLPARGPPVSQPFQMVAGWSRSSRLSTWL